MSTCENFNYDSGMMADSISSLQASKEKADAAAETMRDAFFHNLLDEGIQGDTANVLADTFVKEIVEPLTGYSESSAEFIKTNEQVNQLGEENSENTRKIAS